MVRASLPNSIWTDVHRLRKFDHFEQPLQSSPWSWAEKGSLLVLHLKEWPVCPKRHLRSGRWNASALLRCKTWNFSPLPASMWWSKNCSSHTPTVTQSVPDTQIHPPCTFPSVSSEISFLCFLFDHPKTSKTTDESLLVQVRVFHSLKNSFFHFCEILAYTALWNQCWLVFGRGAGFVVLNSNKMEI